MTTTTNISEQPVAIMVDHEEGAASFSETSVIVAIPT
jgi:hypothetical protein